MRRKSFDVLFETKTGMAELALNPTLWRSLFYFTISLGSFIGVCTNVIFSQQTLGIRFAVLVGILVIKAVGMTVFGCFLHGHIAGIGFAAYCSLLERTINALKNGAEDSMPEPDPVLEITLDAYIPDDYIADPRYKMEIYRRCSDLEYEDREDLLDEIIDRFGEPPIQVVTLWRVATLRSLCRLLKISGISVKTNEVRITFGEKSIANPAGVMNLVKEYSPNAQFKNGTHGAQRRNSFIHY